MTRNDADGKAIDISKEIVYKIEVAANRYDLLCLEGISEALRAYLGISKAPRYNVKKPENPIRIVVKPETASVRPYVVGCVLRNITFDHKNYNSFIDLQDKLHNNICRKRTLASMGTHDLDKLASDEPITYEAQKPEDIVFQALKQKEAMDCVKLFEVFKNDIKMKKFLPILEPHERYPVFYDKNRQVLSLPPIINSEATKITLDTKNVFIEITGTDLVKTKVCLAIIAAQFSRYCAEGAQYVIEQVQVDYEADASRSELTPSMSYHAFDLELQYVNRLLGIDIDVEKAKECAEKMGLNVLSNTDSAMKIEFAPTRSDILHPCDLIEDIGIGYGYNNIAKVFPKTNTVGAFQPNNKFSDLLRQELAQAGYIEQLTFSLISFKDNYENMRLPVNQSECVQISNPKALEFQIVRTSLLPGLLKCLQGNKKEPIPQKIFELSDCCALDASQECGAKNVRKISAMVCD
jgi:phenylalanyl-tRNA synthetase beta chain